MTMGQSTHNGKRCTNCTCNKNTSYLEEQKFDMLTIKVNKWVIIATLTIGLLGYLLLM